jgi:hypothetical protein
MRAPNWGGRHSPTTRSVGLSERNVVGAMAGTVNVAHHIPAGWYPDRDDRSRRRWWDGTGWTDYYSAMPTRPLPDDDAPPLALHSLRAALMFRDRVPAAVLSGLIVANVAVVAVLLRAG